MVRRIITWIAAGVAAVSVGFISMVAYLFMTSGMVLSTDKDFAAIKRPPVAKLVRVIQAGEARIVHHNELFVDVCLETVGDQSELAHVSGGRIRVDEGSGVPAYLVASHCVMPDKSIVIGVDYEKSGRIQRALDSLEQK
jgi:hypothetical protein